MKDYIIELVRFSRAHPLLASGLLLAGLLLGASPLIQAIAPVPSTQLLRYVDHLDHIASMALGLFIAYKWNPALGAVVIFTTIAAHVPYLLLVQSRVELPEALDTELTLAIGFVGVVFIGERAKAVRKREAAERAQREAERRYQFLFQNTSDGIALVDTSNDRFIEVNQAYVRLKGHSAAEFTGMPVQEVAATDITALVAKAKGTTTPLDLGEVAYVDPAGVARVVVVSIVPLANDLAFAILHDITQVRQHEQALQGLSRRLVELQETERRFLARELHDEIGQQLTGLKLILDVVCRLPIETARARIAETTEIVGQLINQVSNLSLELRPPMLEEMGLLPSLDWHLKRYTSQTGVQVDFTRTGLEGVGVPYATGVAAYRIIQEALTNVARHAGVKQAFTRVSAAGGTLRLEVEDRGVGFNAAQALADPRSVGLIGMRERASALMGWVTVDSAPGAGARITAEMPLSEPPQG